MARRVKDSKWTMRLSEIVEVIKTKVVLEDEEDPEVNIDRLIRRLQLCKCKLKYEEQLKYEEANK